MNYENIYDTLQTQGYYQGSFDDFWKDPTLNITKQDFEKASDYLRTTEQYLESHADYRHNYIEQFQQYYLQDPNYTGPKPTQEELEHLIPYSRRHIRQKFIEDAIAGGANIRTTQQWAQIGFPDGKEMQQVFNDLTVHVTTNVYKKELLPHVDKLLLNGHYTIYKKGDFAELHQDGCRSTRHCVIIYYFAKPETYNNSGGRFVFEVESVKSNIMLNYPHVVEEMLEKNDPYLKTVIPVYGTYVMLDLKKFNLAHGVEVVKDDFVRYAYNVFVGLPEGLT